MVKDFLIKNNFILNDFGGYSNDKCDVFIHPEYYEVVIYDISIDIISGSIYSSNLEIYWLIGVLTYYNLMDKNYKK